MTKKKFIVVKREVTEYEVEVDVDFEDEYLKPGYSSVRAALVMTAADEKGYEPKNNGMPLKSDVRYVEIVDGDPVSDILTREHDCENKCPQCGAYGGQGDDIEWDLVDVDTPITQKATCQKCGCLFQEVHKYNHTLILEKGQNDEDGNIQDSEG